MRDNAIKISTNLRMVTYMKLKKLLIISLSFILTSTFLITTLSASSTLSIGKYGGWWSSSKPYSVEY